MKRAAWLMLLALAACTARPAPSQMAAPAGPAACRTGPDGARPVADRGIGGTGAPAAQRAERGIGGTGIIGVITGFASVCVAGEEVATPADLPTLVDGQPARPEDLRAGQVVAMQATGPAGALQAQQVAVQHAVVGPVQSVGRGTMMVAGQMVFVSDTAGRATDAKPGDWVAVSGLPQGGNVIAATRIDPAPTGPVLVRGELVGLYGVLRIGTLVIRLPRFSHPPSGWPVIATGHLEGDVLIADSVVRDVAAESPSAYFGPAFSSFIVESYVAVVPGGYLVNRDFVAGAAFGEIGTRGRGIASYGRRDGGLVATGLHMGAGSGAFEPAPVPRGGAGGPDRMSGFGRGFGPRGAFSPGASGTGNGPDGGSAGPGPPARR